MSLRDVHYRAQYVSGVDNLVRDFYIPTLNQSVLYQRRTAYFNSRALAMAARGLSGLIQNGGSMQLLCSVQLDAAEEAVLKDPHAYAERVAADVAQMLAQPHDEIDKQRFALLAKLLESGRLEIKIAVRRGGIYHEKAGIFKDAQGNIVAFNGSGNETPGGWVNNTESFHVFTSWEDDRHIKPELETFHRLWNGLDPKTEVLPLPFAVVKGLLEFKDYFREKWDEPLDMLDPLVDARPGFRWTPGLAYVFEAPRLWNHHDFAYGETAVKPFEHQDYIASTVLAAWPPRYLFADEVGLGKTIEAGLVIKGFLASGRIDRLLILVPSSVLRQFQAELYTKFAIEAWRLDGDYVYGPQPDPNQEAPKERVDAANPFRSKPILLVSSQLVRSDERRKQVLGLEYDLVVVDEAHHARARSNAGRREPNKLLEVLQELRYQTQGLVLMTATPIQVDRRELWDLLDLLELPGKWQDEDAFNRFFDALDAPETDWAFLLDMVASALQAWGLDEGSLTELGEEYPGIDLYRLGGILKEQRVAEAFQLPPEEQKVLKILLYRHAPVRRMVFRNTRELLKQYVAQGKFSGKIAERETIPDEVELRGSPDDLTSEAGLYARLDQYVRDYYAKYDSVRKGLGFIMEVYRKRLTSSMYAIRCSLERRHTRIRTALDTGDYAALLKDLKEDEDSLDLSEEAIDAATTELTGVARAGGSKADALRQTLEAEAAFLEAFLWDLKSLPADSKAAYLDDLVRGKFASGTRRIIVFTQFADTMDFLLSHFRDQYGTKLGSYSGAGGTYWNGREWVACSKQQIQEKFRDPADPLALLICTDAASEGLNLQTCDTLVNYDIPWNPMRIEQRIGRVDRIGQESPVVKVHTLFYANTVETKVYQRCLERIGYFKSALGHLQPILQATEKAIRAATLAPTKAAEEAALQDLNKQYEALTAQVNENYEIQQLLNHYSPRLPLMRRKAPISQADLETALQPLLEQAGWIRQGKTWLRGEEIITFDPELLDKTGDRATYVTPLNPIARLVGNLPELPMSIDQGQWRAHRIEVQGLTGWVIERENSFWIAEHYTQLADGQPSGARYSSLDEARRGMAYLLREQKRRQVESEKIAWTNRLRNWEARVTLYLERVAFWKWRTGTKIGALDAYSPESFHREWQDYLLDPERSVTRQLADMVHYRPQFDTQAKRPRGRAPQTSPRDTDKESHMLKELAGIQKKMGLLEQQALDLTS